MIPNVIMMPHIEVTQTENLSFMTTETQGHAPTVTHSSI